jgi:hypothetical protein
LSILLTVESLTSTTAARLRNSRLSGSVAAGRSRRSASNSFLAAPFRLGFDPGRFFGAREDPSRTAAV